MHHHRDHHAFRSNYLLKRLFLVSPSRDYYLLGDYRLIVVLRAFAPLDCLTPVHPVCVEENNRDRLERKSLTQQFTLVDTICAAGYIHTLLGF